MSCARWIPFLGREDAGDGSLALELTLDTDRYRQGEPLTCEVALVNRTDEHRAAPNLDRMSLRFTQARRTPLGMKNLRYVEPVYSEKEQVGVSKVVKAGLSLRRRFLFTTTTMEPGDYQMMAIYQSHAPAQDASQAKIYGNTVHFTVSEDVFARRNVNGVLVEEEARRIAAEAAGAPEAETEARLIVDEMGFLKWWINVSASEEGNAGAKSYFIDPYLCRVWREAKPFTADEAPGAPFDRDSKTFRQLLEKRRHQRGLR